MLEDERKHRGVMFGQVRLVSKKLFRSSDLPFVFFTIILKRRFLWLFDEAKFNVLTPSQRSNKKVLLGEPLLDGCN